MGENGAGKSTLINLVCRFFEPTEGRVLIDGRDARERSQLWLHSAIGYVLQTPHLFSGTVADNIRYGKPDATVEEGIEAAKKAEEEKVPIVRDIPLARALHSQCEVGQEIPAELFAPVAGVLAFVLSLKRRGTVGGFHQAASPGGTYLGP